MVIEICCSSISSVKNAINYGANRIELCQDLRNDGITPSKRLLNSAIKISTKPINVLIRPRIGDFFYSSEEIKLIEYEIKQIKLLPINPQPPVTIIFFIKILQIRYDQLS